MPLKKEDRKEHYSRVLNLLLRGEPKQAYHQLASTCGEDTGLFVFADYDEIVAKHSDANTNGYTYHTRGEFEAWMDEHRHHEQFVYVHYKGRWIAVNAIRYPHASLTGHGYTYCFYGQYHNALLTECIMKIAIPCAPESLPAQAEVAHG